MVSEYPAYDDAMNDPEADRDMELVMDVIGSIRNIRGEMNILPSKKLKVILAVADTVTQELLRSSKDYIINLARLEEEITIGGKIEEPKGVATGVAGNINIYVSLEGVVDIAGEKARLEKEIAKITKELSAISRKLANTDFKQKAAEAVIKKEEAKFADLKEKLNVLEAAAEKLKTMAS